MKTYKYFSCITEFCGLTYHHLLTLTGYSSALVATISQRKNNKLVALFICTAILTTHEPLLTFFCGKDPSIVLFTVQEGVANTCI